MKGYRLNRCGEYTLATGPGDFAVTNVQPSRRQWDAVKGVLILCVVVGHSSLANVVLPALKDLLYSFHVQAFLVIPFLYERRTAGRRSVADICVRYLVPYSVFVVSCSVLRQMSSPQQLTGWLYGLGHGLITGNDVYLKGTTGLYLFWFLPVITWVSLLHILYYGRTGWSRWVLLGAFAACHVLLPATSWSFRRTYPWFGSHVAFYIVGLGIAAHFIWRRASYRRIRRWRCVMPAACAVCFVIMFATGSAVSLAHLSCPSFEQPGRILLHDAIPILVCLTLLGFSDILAAVPPLAYLGQRTLPIYLMHQPCMIAGTGFCTTVLSQPQMLWGQVSVSIVSMVLAVAAPVGVMYVLDSVPRLKRVLFPRRVEDFLGPQLAPAKA
jgi:fucose 4-O-acetylase-like acetyltransferase